MDTADLQERRLCRFCLKQAVRTIEGTDVAVCYSHAGFAQTSQYSPTRHITEMPIQGQTRSL